MTGRESADGNIVDKSYDPSLGCHLAVVEGLVRFYDPENSAGGGM